MVISGAVDTSTLPVVIGAGWVDPLPSRAGCAPRYRLAFWQRITLTTTGTVTYRWTREDGTHAPVQYLTFAEPGSQFVVDGWDRSGSPGATFDGWEQIQILTPVTAVGEKVAYRYVCPDRR
jgi:hypothetical protein